MEGLQPDQSLKKNVDLDNHGKRRPSDFGLSPQQLGLIEDSHRKNQSEEGIEPPSSARKNQLHISISEFKPVKMETESGLQSKQTMQPRHNAEALLPPAVKKISNFNAVSPQT